MMDEFEMGKIKVKGEDIENLKFYCSKDHEIENIWIGIKAYSSETLKYITEQVAKITRNNPEIYSIFSERILKKL